MELLSSYLEQVEKEIQQIHYPLQPINLYEPQAYFLSLGGKRIRPILTLIASDIFGRESKKAMDVALGVELFHNFTLLHDDIMDNAPLRRNRETIHQKWDVNTAILSGDTMFVKAMEYILKGESNAINDLFLKTAREVCEGQQMDMDFEQRTDVSINEYIEMIRLKTSVLLGCALKCGAIVGNASSTNQELCYNLGVDIGIAFQLQDDYLDTFGNSPKVGKQIGGDILANKKTFLYLKAFEIANEQQKEALIHLQNEKNTALKIAETKRLFEDLSIPSLIQKEIEYYFQQGMANFNAIEVSDTEKAPLKEVINFLYQRNF